MVEHQCSDCSYPTIRPRGALARTLYNKQIADRHLAHLDYSEWYTVNQSDLLPEVKSLFHQMSMDNETEKFLSESSDKSDNLFLQIFYSLVKLFLSLFMSQTSINGLLGRGSMFVFSESQFEILSGYSKNDLTSKRSLLDLGAGDGSVTQIMEPFFHFIHVTELSKPMKSQLAKKGFRVLDEDKISVGYYDAVCCLNVLDRCDKPLSMMSTIRNSMKINDASVAIVALVLPFTPYVESVNDNKQVEDMSISGKTLEEQVNSLVTEVFPNAGFKVLKWTRLPYLCEGDLSQSYYWLDDVLFVLSINQSDNNIDEKSVCYAGDKPSNDIPQTETLEP